MIATLLLPLIAGLEDPKELLLQIQKHYRSLSSFTMEIEHHDSSGLFPGDYKQSLKWQSPNKFELTVTKPSKFQAQEGEPGGMAPNYVCDGTTVASSGGSFPPRNDSAEPRENVMPGWEVSGGFILSWLMKTPNGELFLNPPKGSTISYKLLADAEWKGLTAAEIQLTFMAGNDVADLKASLFVDRAKKQLVGFSFSRPEQSGWSKYFNQIEVQKN